MRVWSVLVRQVGRDLTIAVSDPTMSRQEVTVLIQGPHLTPVAADDGVDVRRVPGATMITATTDQTYGASLTATLAPR